MLRSINLSRNIVLLFVAGLVAVVFMAVGSTSAEAAAPDTLAVDGLNAEEHTALGALGGDHLVRLRGEVAREVCIAVGGDDRVAVEIDEVDRVEQAPAPHAPHARVFLG